VLLLGLWGAAVFFLFAFYNPSNLVIDKIYWWWVVHIWVEGVWELIMASVLAFLMLKLTGVDREVVDKWLYVIVATALFSGILGTGHHYYWIGMPGYWQWVGSIFSSFEIVPFFAMMAFAFVMVWKGRRDHPNKAALLWSLGCATLAFFGGGVWGFMHTLHGINYYTHGTQITAAHGHLAFYGAYVLLVMAMIYVTLPAIRGVKDYNPARAYASFWWMTISMVFIVLTITGAGMVQVYMERLMGLDYVAVKATYNLWFWIFRAIFGLGFLIGTAIFVLDYFKLGKEPYPALEAIKKPTLS
jgi:nitric oxide reductase subunit B